MNMQQDSIYDLAAIQGGTFLTKADNIVKKWHKNNG